MSQIESDEPPLIMASRSVSFHAASHGPPRPRASLDFETTFPYTSGPLCLPLLHQAHPPCLGVLGDSGIEKLLFFFHRGSGNPDLTRIEFLQGRELIKDEKQAAS